MEKEAKQDFYSQAYDRGRGTDSGFITGTKRPLEGEYVGVADRNLHTNVRRKDAKPCQALVGETSLDHPTLGLDP